MFKAEQIFKNACHVIKEGNFMCGIVGFTGKNNAVSFLLDGLERLEYRGYDSAGVAVLNNKSFAVSKTTSRIDSLKKEVGGNALFEGKLGIGHTRWATHGMPSHENAHPHLSENLKFAVVHNGIIENYTSLKAELESEGVEFLSETDTEVIPQLLQKYYKGDLKSAVDKTVKRLEGSFALGILCSDHPETLVAVKHFSPLVIGLAENANIIASDVTAIVSHTKNVIYIKDGETAYLTPHSVEIYDSDGAIAKGRISVINWDVEAAEKSGYEHFMMKEIMEQPCAVSKTLNNYIRGREIVFENLKLDREKLQNINRIRIIACGSAYHAGVVGKYIFEEMLRIPSEVDIASEFRYRRPLIDKNTLTIAISQSGETADTLAAAREAKSGGSHLLSILNVVGSSIAKESDDVIYTLAGPEIAVATTKGYSTQLAVIYLLAIWAARMLGSMSSERIESLFDSLCLLPEAIEKVILEEPKIKEIAQKCEEKESLFFIGRNIDYAVALEASLKLKEISYIHSEAYAAGELKHGTISLIEPGRTVIALCGYERLQEKMLSNIKEVHARGAHIIACALEDNKDIITQAEDVIFIPKTDPLLVAALEVIPFQIYAYYVSLFRGCDIDKPRNLAKSVTVE